MESSESDAVRAGQVLYGNPRANQLPGVKDDFQTVFHTDDVTPEELKFIEPRLHGIARQDSRTGKVFFEVPHSGRFVVGQIVQTDERDRGERPQFLAHALIFDKNGLRRFDNNPFVVFASFTFLKTFGEVISHVEKVRSNSNREQVPDSNRWIPSATLTPKWSCNPTPDFWEDCPPDTTFRLLVFAERTDRDRRETLALAGSEAQVRSTLNALFSVISPDQRLKCTFDTLFCSQGETRLLQSCPYWAVGVVPNWKPTIRHSFVPCSAESKTFQLTTDLTPATTFEQWVRNALAIPDGWQWLGKIELIRRASDWWDLNDDAACPDISAEVVDLNAPFWREHIQSNLDHFLSAGTSETSSPENWIDAVMDSRSIRLWRDIDASRITEILTRHYWERVEAPNQYELDCLAKWYTNNNKQVPSPDMWRLACMWCRWTKQWDKLTQFLWKLPEESRGETVQWVLSTFDRDIAADTEETFRQRMADAFASPFKSNADARSFTDALVKVAVRPDNASQRNPSVDPSTLGRMTNAMKLLCRWFGLEK